MDFKDVYGFRTSYLLLLLLLLPSSSVYQGLGGNLENAQYIRHIDKVEVFLQCERIKCSYNTPNLSYLLHFHVAFNVSGVSTTDNYTVISDLQCYKTNGSVMTLIFPKPSCI